MLLHWNKKQFKKENSISDCQSRSDQWHLHRTSLPCCIWRVSADSSFRTFWHRTAYSLSLPLNSFSSWGKRDKIEAGYAHCNLQACTGRPFFLGAPLTYQLLTGANQKHRSPGMASVPSTPRCLVRSSKQGPYSNTYHSSKHAIITWKKLSETTLWTDQDGPRIPPTFSVINVRLRRLLHPCLPVFSVVIFDFSKYMCPENRSIEWNI